MDIIFCDTIWLGTKKNRWRSDS